MLNSKPVLNGKPVRSVLLVEDDPNYNDLLHEAFVEAGFRTLQASNGEKALEILRDEPVDLVVSDFIMPELNGLELCRLVTDDLRLSKVKVVLYSCNTDNTFRKRAHEMGALDYLPKSEDTEALVRQICELVGLEAETQQHQATVNGNPTVEERLRAVSNNVGQLRVLVDSLLDFVQIVGLSEQSSPATRLAWEAAQRTSTDIKRVLAALENTSGVGSTALQAQGNSAH